MPIQFAPTRHSHNTKFLVSASENFDVAIWCSGDIWPSAIPMKIMTFLTIKNNKLVNSFFSNNSVKSINFAVFYVFFGISDLISLRGRYLQQTPTEIIFYIPSKFILLFLFVRQPDLISRAIEKRTSHPAMGEAPQVKPLHKILCNAVPSLTKFLCHTHK